MMMGGVKLVIYRFDRFYWSERVQGDPHRSRASLTLQGLVRLTSVIAAWCSWTHGSLIWLGRGGLGLVSWARAQVHAQTQNSNATNECSVLQWKESCERPRERREDTAVCVCVWDACTKRSERTAENCSRKILLFTTPNTIFLFVQHNLLKITAWQN